MGVDNSMGLVCCFKLDRKICSRAGGEDSDEDGESSSDSDEDPVYKSGVPSKG